MMVSDCKIRRSHPVGLEPTTLGSEGRSTPLDIGSQNCPKSRNFHRFPDRLRIRRDPLRGYKFGYICGYNAYPAQYRTTRSRGYIVANLNGQGRSMKSVMVSSEHWDTLVYNHRC